jgi:hypothetical protein
MILAIPMAAPAIPLNPQYKINEVIMLVLIGLLLRAFCVSSTFL